MAINNEPDLHTNIICANIFVRKDDKYLVLRRSPQKKWLPNLIHPIGGKVNLNENPFTAARREVLEESGLAVKNIKLEAVILEIAPVKDDPTNWLIFHFSADYESGEIISTEEGTLEWHSADEIKSENLFPSLKAVIDSILNPEIGTVFATVSYNENKDEVTNSVINYCA